MQGPTDASSSGGGTKHNRTQQQQQQQHSLFSNDCIVLLKRALELATETAAQQQQQQTIASSTARIVYPKSRGNAATTGGGGGGDDDSSLSSSVEGAGRQEDDDESSSSASESSDGSEKEAGEEDEEDQTNKPRDEDLNKVQQGSSSQQTSSNSRSVQQPTMIKKRNKLPAQTTMDKRQRDLQVRKHIESLVFTRLPLSSLQNPELQKQQQQQETTTKQQLELRLASALLSKEFRHVSDDDDNDDDQGGGVAVRVAQARYFLSLAENNLPWVVLFLRSGRFSGAIFQSGVCIQHRNLQRYTVRKGQGKAQSMQDASGRRPKSIGAQLRRAGEEALKNDITETLSNWKNEIQQAAVILISCPKTMRKTLYDCMESSSGVIQRNDNRIRRVPLDLGRPTFENCVIIHDVLATVTVAPHTTTTTNRTDVDSSTRGDKGGENVNHASTTPLVKKDDSPTIPKEEVLEIPLEPIHVAAKCGNLKAIQDLLAAAEDDDDIEATNNDSNNDGRDGECAMVNRVAGVDLMTPLHFAAALTTNLSLDQQQSILEDTSSSGGGVVDAAEVAAECVMELLIRGKANPAKLDARGRPPYFLASHEKVREAFRMARAQLGEDYCKWDEEAKVGPPLTVDDLTARKEKEAEKKKKKRARQKEKKAKEKAQQEDMEKRRQEEEEKQKQQEEAKRVRDGLAPKAAGSNVCDFCQTVCKGRQRSQMFKRLDYNYCTTECLQKHKRELMAAAALARFNSS